MGTFYRPNGIDGDDDDDDNVWLEFEDALDSCGYYDIKAVRDALAEAGLTVVRVKCDPAVTSAMVAKAVKRNPDT